MAEQNISHKQRKNWPRPGAIEAQTPVPVPGGRVWPYRTAPMETIDRLMDMQHTLFELAQVTNDYYRLQMLILILTAFSMIVFDSYGVLDLMTKEFKSGSNCI